MRVACLGGGPAGLYFAISMKLANPAHDIDVFERNRAGDTFGWGVVFSDQTVDNLRRNDPVSAETIIREFAHWDDIDVRLRGESHRSSGHGFIGIGRKRMLQILQARAEELGVRLHFEHEFGCDLADYPDYDLVIGADGVNSRLRDKYAAHLGVNIQTRANKFIWLGTTKVFDAFTFAFEQTEHGWVWAHAYRFDNGLSTFIVECAPATWSALGLDTMDQEQTCRWAETIFARHLDGHPTMSNAAHMRGAAVWLNFRRVLCERWAYDKLVLLGDAAHTAHFSIGSGTKLALEDAIKLSEVLNRPGLSRSDALIEYQAERTVEVLKIQNAARNSTEWFETLDRYIGFEPVQFTYSLLTRSQRISHENLRARDSKWLDGVERWFMAKATGSTVNAAPPPLFAPFKLRGMTLKNRIVMSPMATYSARNGVPDDFHLVHYGARAQGGAGLIFTEMTCVAPDARITPGCAGLWNGEQAESWARIVDFVHARSDAKMCLQLGHAGPKGSTNIGWEGMDTPLASGNWPLLAPSDVAWGPQNQTPSPMTRADMDRVCAEFVHATRLASTAGFDMIELHAAHGYLLSAFITPLHNKRTDAYGGPLENRLRFPLEVFSAMRAAWPHDKPMSVRISATDWMGEAGIQPGDAVDIARAFSSAGCDLVDVSAGQTSTAAKPVYGRMFQTPFADRIRNEAAMATMAVGNISEADQANSILAAGRADLVALGRPHLLDPMWTLRAAAAANHRDIFVPPQYDAGMVQLARSLQKASAPAAALRA